ncbi:MAG: hypothetical protein IPK75_18830 [Acidobacteria bacterium]|nr:hypothetical protein [Acidobacteriota bacterium]
MNVDDAARATRRHTTAEVWQRTPNMTPAEARAAGMSAPRERPAPFKQDMVSAIRAGRKTQTRRAIKLREFGPSDTPGYDWHFRDKQLRWHDYERDRIAERCPYGKPGDRLWVREAWRAPSLFDHLPPRDIPPATYSRYRHARFMPRWASRIDLEVTEVRAQRLQEISEEDAIAEGARFGPDERHRDHDPRWIMGRCRDCAHWNTNLLPNGGRHRSCPYHYSTQLDPQPSYGDAGQGCSTSFVLANGSDESSRFQFAHLWESINGAGAWEANPWVWAISFEQQEGRRDDR